MSEPTIQPPKSPPNPTEDGQIPTSQERLKPKPDEDSDVKHKPTEGGRLQFYLDGKVVLELSDRCEGGKTWWVPVTQKTYWPPPPPSCSTPGSTIRQESSASFSVSDDSSVQSQSSPWLRETRWKNPNPHRAKSSGGMSLHIKSREMCCYQWKQRRRPFHWQAKCHLKPDEKCSHCKVKWKCHSLRPSVSAVAAQLLEKALARRQLKIATESIVSPRKRLLRDMEKVRLNERSSSPSWNSLKKAKAVVPPTPLPTHSVGVAGPAFPHHHSQPTKVYDRQSSYSIDSLLNRESQEASNSSSFLRTLLRKNSSSAVNGVAAKNKGHNYSQPRLPLHPTEFPAETNLPSVLVTRNPVWLPYNSGPLHPLIHPAPPPSVPRAGPSSRSETVSTKPSVDDEDEAPLNLTTSRGRDT